MNMFMPKIILLMSLIAMFGCSVNGRLPKADGLCVAFTGDFDPSGSVVSGGRGAVSRATSTAFEHGDELGVFGVIEGQQFAASGNRIDNACFKVAADGSIKGDPAVYYPEGRRAVTLRAYYPYSATVVDATKLAFAVHTDQTSAVKIKSSDLCYARQSVVASANAHRFLFKHMNSRLVINLTNGVAGTTISSLRLLEVSIGSTLDLGDGTISTTGAKSSVALAAQSSSQAILPAQTIKAGRQLLEAVLSDGTRYTFTPEKDDITLSQSTQTTLSLTLNDNRTITLNNPPQIVPWETGSTTGLVDQAVNNNFTAHWVLPHPDGDKATRVVVSVNDPKTGKNKNYDCPLLIAKADLPSACSYTFDLVPDLTDSLTYPYRIDTLTFYNQSTVIQKCRSLISVNIYKQGAYSLGINQTNILEVVTGAVIDWGSMSVSGGISTAGVTNDFEVQMVEPRFDYLNLNKVRLTIGGVVYEWSAGVSLQAGHNKLLAKLTRVSFPAQGANHAPTLYPYAIEKVELFRGNTLAYGADCYIPVGRPGLITLQLIDGDVVGIVSNAIGGWESQGESGSLGQTGEVTTNVFGLLFYDANYQANTVERMVLTINGSKVIFAPYVMQGNKLRASSAQGIDITSAQATGSKPTSYPYTITNVELYDAQSQKLADMEMSLRVPWAGDVLIKVVR